MRINKYISDSGYCSRREADRLIEQGAVTIDGKRAKIGSTVSEGQEVRIHGEVIINNNKSIFIAYNKPYGIVTTTDLNDSDNIISAIGFEERIFPIGRLDKDSEGLIILTNEGDIVNKMLRVNNNHDKEYTVTVDKMITEDFIKKMKNGVFILGVVTRKCEIEKAGTHTFNVTLRQGLNRQIRRMCESLGYKVIRLERIRIMHIHLGNLKPGKWRHLREDEVSQLRKSTAQSVKTEEASKRKKKPQPSGAFTYKKPPFGEAKETSERIGKSRPTNNTLSKRTSSNEAEKDGRPANNRATAYKSSASKPSQPRRGSRGSGRRG